VDAALGGYRPLLLERA